MKVALLTSMANLPANGVVVSYLNVEAERRLLFNTFNYLSKKIFDGSIYSGKLRF